MQHYNCEYIPSQLNNRSLMHAYYGNNFHCMTRALQIPTAGHEMESTHGCCTIIFLHNDDGGQPQCTYGLAVSAICIEVEEPTVTTHNTVRSSSIKFLTAKKLPTLQLLLHSIA
jgi:hypothetical protein